MSRSRATIGFLVLLSITSLAARDTLAAPPAASAKDLARCAAIAASDARLACYDALAPSTPTPTPSAPSAPPSASESHPDAKAFGLPKPAPVAVPDVPDLIHAQVTQVNVGRRDGGSTAIQLDNGQSWVVEATEVELKAGDSVTIKRAALGSYLLTTSARHSYRVRRLQ